MKKATFTSRLLAYFLDSIIVLLLSSIVATGFTSKKLESLEEDLEQLITDYTNGEVTMEEYLDQAQELTYDIEKNSVTINCIQVAISTAYFIVFAFLNKGQTLGKKLMKLKVVNNEDKKPTLLQMTIRTSITNQILPNILIIILILVLSKNTFMSIYSIITMITYIFIIASSIMILYRDDKLGLHDMLSKTKVVKEGK